jgi:HNH endonuclease
VFNCPHLTRAPVTMPDRPDIPRSMKRSVRQRCGFGCVVCGAPLCDYDHIEEWSQKQEHMAENITLLCRRHNDEKSHGFLPLAHVREANANPVNLRTGASTPWKLHYAARSASR